MTEFKRSDLMQTPPPTISLIRLPRVGGAWRPNRVARRRCFSTMMPSISSRRAISVLSGVIGIDRVAKRTRVDILLTKYNHKRWTARQYYLLHFHIHANSRVGMPSIHNAEQENKQQLQKRWQLCSKYSTQCSSVITGKILITFSLLIHVYIYVYIHKGKINLSCLCKISTV